MKLLLDTHIWVWSVADVSRLADPVRRALEDPENELWICAISVWEQCGQSLSCDDWAVIIETARAAMEETPEMKQVSRTDRARRALAALGRFRSGRGDIARDHDRHLAVAYAQRGDADDAAKTDRSDTTA